MSGSTTETEKPGAQPTGDEPTPEPRAPGPGAGGEGTGSGPQSPEPSPPPAPEGEPPAPPGQQPGTPQVDWRDKRIATLTRRLREMQEQTRQAPPPSSTAPPAPAGFTQQDVDRLAEEKARHLSVVQDFNRRCDEAALAGRAQFGEMEFNGRIGQLQKLVDVNDPQSAEAYNAMLVAALETGEAPRVLHELGADLNEAQRILALPATKMAVELTKRAMVPSTQLSGAPKPITPVGGRGTTHERIAPDDPDRADHLSTAEWMRRREAQLAERRQQQR